MLRRTVLMIAWVTFCLVQSTVAQQPSDAAAGKTDPAAAMKESLQKSMAALRQYEWIETTVVSVKGEEKSRTQTTCYYGADGKLQKVPVGAVNEEKKKRGLRGKIAEDKKADMTDAVTEAVALVKQYVPPDPARIQTAREAGRLMATPPNSNGDVRVVITDFLKPGDSVSVEMNPASSRISRVAIATFTDEAKDTVEMKVAFGAFADGTAYPASIQLSVAAENLGVVIENSGYKKLGG